MSRRSIATPMLLIALLALGCQRARESVPTPKAFRPAPIVQVTRHSSAHAALAKIALAPLEASLELQRERARGASADVDPPALIGTYLVDALVARGVQVVPPSDVEGLLAGSGDPLDSARRVAREFGAKGMILGRVQAFREREGGPLAVREPARVAFEATLYSAPDGRRLWTGRFAHTQHSSNERPLAASRYPGGGTRWLTAEELGRWGAEHFAQALLQP